MGDFSTRTMTNQDGDFYRLLGPFLSRREIVDELGFPVWDDDGKIWFIVFCNASLIGFSSVRPKQNSVVFSSVYVLPQFRRQGVFKMMLQRLLEYAQQIDYARITTTATPASVDGFLAAGFSAVRKNGRYTVMELKR